MYTSDAAADQADIKMAALTRCASCNRGQFKIKRCLRSQLTPGTFALLNIWTNGLEFAVPIVRQ
jgi:hypothetical protein